MYRVSSCLVRLQNPVLSVYLFLWKSVSSWSDSRYVVGGLDPFLHPVVSLWRWTSCSSLPRHLDSLCGDSEVRRCLMFRQRRIPTSSPTSRLSLGRISGPFPYDPTDFRFLSSPLNFLWGVNKYVFGKNFLSMLEREYSKLQSSLDIEWFRCCFRSDELRFNQTESKGVTIGVNLT